MPATAHVVRVTKTWDGLLAGKDRAAAVYQVLFDEPQYASEVVAKTASDGTTTIPAIGAAHGGDAALYVASVTAETLGGPTLFQVIVEYGRSSQSEPIERQPTSTAWLWWTDNAATVEALDQDLDGYPIRNSAGEPFDPPLTEEWFVAVYRGRRLFTETAWNGIDAAGLINTTNNGSVTIRGHARAAHLCLIKTLRATPVTVDGVSMQEVEVEIHVDAINGYYYRYVVDRGYRGYNDDDVLEEFKDEDGTPRAQPTYLDGSGKELNVEGSVVAALKFFRTKNEAAWTALNLG